MALPVHFFALLWCLTTALSLTTTPSVSSPSTAYSDLLNAAFSDNINPTNLTLPLAFLQSSNYSANDPPISCRQVPSSTRRQLDLRGCAEVVFTVLGVGDVAQPQRFTDKTPWILPTIYTDTKDTCSVRFQAMKPGAADIFPISLVLQTAAQIGFHCQMAKPMQNLGGTAYIGEREMFLLDLYGPASGAETS
ncbi:hypothetical protein N7G274_007650 [Stereocaulon virgatum]|uniref:Uncharacterized protein n=1 Tax=Stereocaulon virgatum TaxID=373712 RepID=A0ABR4A3A0_9LECA